MSCNLCLSAVFPKHVPKSRIVGSLNINILNLYRFCQLSFLHWIDFVVAFLLALARAVPGEAHTEAGLQEFGEGKKRRQVVGTTLCKVQ